MDPGVGLYIDDVYIGNAVGGTMTLRDIANVQVLRGPQGTLFGRNTIGGAVLMTTTDPGEEFGGEVRAGLGDDSLIDGFVALDIPFSDSLKTRWSVGMRKQDGYVTRPDGTDLGDTNTLTASTKWVCKPTDDVHARPSPSTTPTPMRTAVRWCSPPSTKRPLFRASRAEDAGLPGGVVLPGLRSAGVPMLDDPRCANDLQGAGPYANNGSVAAVEHSSRISAPR